MSGAGGEPVQVDASDAYVRPVVMFEAVCTCGWKQRHSLLLDAKHDANLHRENGRHR